MTGRLRISIKDISEEDFDRAVVLLRGFAPGDRVVFLPSSKWHGTVVGVFSFNREVVVEWDVSRLDPPFPGGPVTTQVSAESIEIWRE